LAFSANHTTKFQIKNSTKIMLQTTNQPEYITATIKDWHHLLKKNEYKMSVLNVLKNLVLDEKIEVYAFCIMSNHLHLIWHLSDKTKDSEIRKYFFENTAKKFKSLLEKENIEFLEKFKSTQKDRSYHFWKRRPLAIELFSKLVFEQKLEYIHENPVKAGLCNFAENYYYSSAKFYETGVDDFGFLTHYKE
jgi:putative transposase